MTKKLNLEPGEIVYRESVGCFKLTQRIAECEKLLTEATGDAAWGYLAELMGLIAAKYAVDLRIPDDPLPPNDPRIMIRERWQQGYRDGVMLIQMELNGVKGG